MTEASVIAAPRETVLRRTSDTLIARRGLFLLLLLAPPLLWLGVIYLGALFALLAQSFFSIDEYSGTIVYEPTLKTFGELLQPANFDIIIRTLAISTTAGITGITVTVLDCTLVVRHGNFCDRLSWRMTYDRQSEVQSLSDSL